MRDVGCIWSQGVYRRVAFRLKGWGPGSFPPSQLVPWQQAREAQHGRGKESSVSTLRKRKMRVKVVKGVNRHTARCGRAQGLRVGLAVPSSRLSVMPCDPSQSTPHPPCPGLLQGLPISTRHALDMLPLPPVPDVRCGEVCRQEPSSNPSPLALGE